MEDYIEQGYISSNPNLSRSENIDGDENPLDLYKCASNETVLINKSHENEFISINPGECLVPVPFSDGLFREELSHPHLLPYKNLDIKLNVTYHSYQLNISLSVFSIVLISFLQILTIYFLHISLCKV